MKYPNKAVVLGTNYYIGLSVVRNLGRHGVYVVTVDYDEHTFYGQSRYVKERLIAPHYEKEEEEFVEFLIDYAKHQKKKPVLCPTADLYVEFMEKNYDVLKEYYLWPNDKKGLYLELMDKQTLLNYTKPLGIKTPEIIDMHEENFYERVTEELGYPCIIKPRDSMPFVNKYRAKVMFVNNEEELREKIEMCRRDAQEVFVQRIIPGPEKNCYSFDVYIDKNGTPVSYMTTNKIRQWPVNFGASTYARQHYIPELYDICMPLFESVGYRGFAEVELKRDSETGEIYLVEVNVRFVNFTELQAQMGMNTPLFYFRDALGLHVCGPKIKRDCGVYWKYTYEDISAVITYLKTGQMTVKDILMDHRCRKVHSTFATDDLNPGKVFFRNAIVKQLKKIFR